MLFKTSNATASYHYALTYENLFFAYQFYHISLDALKTRRIMPGKLATSPHHYLTEIRITSHGDGDGDDDTPKMNIVHEKRTNYNENLKRIFI